MFTRRSFSHHTYRSLHTITPLALSSAFLSLSLAPNLCVTSSSIYCIFNIQTSIIQNAGCLYVCELFFFFASSWRILGAKLPVFLFCFVLTFQCINTSRRITRHTNTRTHQHTTTEKIRLPCAFETTLGTDVSATYVKCVKYNSFRLFCAVHQCEVAEGNHRSSFDIFEPILDFSLIEWIWNESCIIGFCYSNTKICSSTWNSDVSEPGKIERWPLVVPLSKMRALILTPYRLRKSTRQSWEGQNINCDLEPFFVQCKQKSIIRFIQFCI